MTVSMLADVQQRLWCLHCLDPARQSADWPRLLRLEAYLIERMTR